MRFNPRLILVISQPVAICAVLGLLTTVAVAWGLAAWLPHRSLIRRSNLVMLPGGPTAGYVAIHELRRPGMVRREWAGGLQPFSAPAFAELASEARLEVPLRSVRQDRSWGRLPAALLADSPDKSVHLEDARGWPWVALWCEMDEQAITGPAGRPAIGGIAIPRGTPTPAQFRALPFLPVWKGLLADTGVFAAAWGAAWAAAWLARRALRLRGRRCAACGYDLAGGTIAVCPECGWRGGRTMTTGPAR
jgi:hypothetical protein